jgi:heparan-alpha-glucosaminide N-acetyltransferase
MSTEAANAAPKTNRITSIDALRGFVMFTMIFVNDLAGAPKKVVPDWMVHFSDRHKHGSGMTFVDLVFPGFLFIAGMSIPLALGGRLNQGDTIGKTCGHVILRSLALLAVGILMVNGESASPDTPGWSPELWSYTMFLSAIFAFVSISPPKAGPTSARFWRIFSMCLRGLGSAGMLYCAVNFHGHDGQAILTFHPLHLRTSWFGILGIIGWAYLVAASIYLVFRDHRTALLGCMALLLCLYAADKKGLFHGLWLASILGIGETGAHSAIVVGGVILASILVTADTAAVWARARFTLLFATGCAAGALLLNGLYGISKNNATPSWCLWSCAIAAIFWLGFYFMSDVCRSARFVSTPFRVAGQNVLLAYLLSEMLPSPFGWVHFAAEPGLAWYVFRSAAWAVLLLALTAVLNCRGVRLKL